MFREGAVKRIVMLSTTGSLLVVMIAISLI